MMGLGCNSLLMRFFKKIVLLHSLIELLVMPVKNDGNRDIYIHITSPLNPKIYFAYMHPCLRNPIFISHAFYNHIHITVLPACAKGYG